MTSIDLARFVCARRDLPTEDTFLDYLIWEYTGFPEFWHIGQDGDTPAECLYTQLDRAARVIKKHGMVDPFVDYKTFYMQDNNLRSA